MERRNALVELDRAELTAALRELRPGAELRGLSLAQGGRANTVYFLDTPDERLVLRLHASLQLGAKERAVLQLVAGDVPTAAVLGHGRTSTGHAYSLLTFVAGVTLAQLLLQNDGPLLRAAGRDLGRALAQLSRRHFPAAGDLNADGRGGLSVKPWPFHDFFAWVLFESPAGARLGQARDRLWRCLQSAQRRFPDPWHVHLVHGDMNPDNLLFDAGGRLQALLDWEFSHAGSIWMDLGNLLRRRPGLPRAPELERGLLEGLRETGLCLPEDWRSLTMLADLSSACEFLSSEQPRPETHARALQQVHEALAVLEPAST